MLFPRTQTECQQPEYQQCYWDDQYYERQQWLELKSRKITNWRQFWQRAARRWSEAIVVQDAKTSHLWTYQALDQLADQIGCWANAALSSRPEQDPPRMGVHLANGALCLATVIGLLKVGIVPVVLNVRNSVQTSLAQASSLGVTIVLGDPIPGMTCLHPHDIVQQTWVGRAAPTVDLDVIGFDQPALIVFSSGATGSNQPHILSHQQLLEASLTGARHTQIRVGQRYYIPLPLSHFSAWRSLLTCIAVGACAVLRDRFSAHQFWADIRTHQCQFAGYNGELWRYLLALPPQVLDRQHPLQTIVGQGLTQTAWDTLVERFGIQRVIEYYAAAAMPLPLINRTNRSGYCGFIPPDHPDAAKVQLVDATGQPVGPNCPGELWVRLDPDVCADVQVNVKANVEADVNLKSEPECDSDTHGQAEPWWRSGDLFCRDASGFFRYIDRLKRSWLIQGHRITANEIEAALVATGYMTEAVVFPYSAPNFAHKSDPLILMASCYVSPDLQASIQASIQYESQYDSQYESVQVWRPNWSSESEAAQLGGIRPLEPQDRLQANDPLYPVVLAQLIQQLPTWMLPTIIRFVPSRHPLTATLNIALEQIIQASRYPQHQSLCFMLCQDHYIPISMPALVAETDRSWAQEPKRAQAV